MNDQNIVIDIEARTEIAQQRIAAMGQLFKGQTAAMTKSLQGVQEQIQALGKQQGFNMPGIRTSSEVMENHMNPAIDKAKTKIGQTSNLANQAKADLDKTGKTGKQAGNDMMEAFDGAAMGLMFFGMQLKRVFGSLMRSGVSTFQNVHSQLENTTTATDRLSGAWQFLKFNIGEALQPVMSQLVPIIDGIAKFVDENKQLTASFLTVGFVLGNLLMAGGALRLAQVAFKDMGKRIGVVETNADDAIQKFKTFKNVAKGIGATIAIGFAIEDVSEAVSAWKEGQRPEAVQEAFTALLQGVGGLVMLSNPVAGGALFALGFTLDFVWDTSPQRRKEIARQVQAATFALGELAGTYFDRSFTGFLRESLIDFFELAAANAVRWTNQLQSMLPGMSGRSQSELQKDINTIQESIRNSLGGQPDVTEARKEFDFNEVYKDRLEELTPATQDKVNAALDPKTEKTMRDVAENTSRLTDELRNRFMKTGQNQTVVRNQQGNLEIINKTANRRN